MAKNNLVENYIEIATAKGEPLRVVMISINTALGTAYRANKLSEWRKTKAVPDPVRKYMMGFVLISLLHKGVVHDISLTNDEIETVVAGLMPPTR